MATATSYTSDQIDSMYGDQADQIAAVDAASIDTAGIDSSGNLTLTRKDSSVINAGSVISSPTGSIVMYGGLSAPPGWLLCDGTAVSRSTYSALFTLLGTRFGAGNGSTTFNVPNLAQRFPRMDIANVGVAAGAASHSHTINGHDHSLEGGSTPAHARTVFVGTAGPNMFHKRISVPNWTATHHGDNTPTGSDSGVQNLGTEVAGNTDVDATGTNAVDVPSALPPYLNLNFIIKT